MGSAGVLVPGYQHIATVGTGLAAGAIAAGQQREAGGGGGAFIVLDGCLL